MSQKITSKNLSYNTSLPPFLANLHAQAGNATGPDPLLARQRRATKKRSASEEAEDVPLVVDEHGNPVEVKVEKDGTVTETEVSKSDDKLDEVEKDASASKKEESKAGFGARKRKTGRIIGDDSGENAPKAQNSKDAASDTVSPTQKQEASESKDKKPKKKAKKIKLSFDDGD